MIHAYYLITINQVLTEDTIDEEGVVTPGQKSLIKTALLELGRQAGPAHKVTHLKPSVDHQKIIVEMERATQPAKAQFCNKMAELLPWTSETISNKTTVTRLGGNNSTYEESRQAAMAEIASDKEGWGEVDN